jgi:pimeloyl-ACP methyl ester carboxylesterase
MPTLTLSPGLTLHYWEGNEQGSSTVVLLHGLGATSRSWQLQFKALISAGYRVLAPDLRGFGQSTYPGRGGLSLMAHDVAALIRTVIAGPVHVAGLSMGGTVALHLALEHPQLIDRLVLINTCARLRPQRLDGWLSYALRYLYLASLSMPSQGRLVARNTFPHPHQAELRRHLAEQIAQADRHGYLAALWSLGCYNVLPRLPEIQAPTLVVTGGRDHILPPARQRDLVEGIRGARQVILPEGGHGVTADQAESFNRVLLDFLGSHRANTAVG